MAQQLRNEGIEQGIEQGIAKGLVEKIQLMERFLKMPISQDQPLLDLKIEKLRERFAELERVYEARFHQ